MQKFESPPKGLKLWHLLRRRPQLQALWSVSSTLGIIFPSNSPWASPVVLVRKLDGVPVSAQITVSSVLLRRRMCSDPTTWRRPQTVSVLTVLYTLDLASGYWQIPVAKNDKEKTAFKTPHGLYEYNVMLFGLCNAGATLQRAMDKIFRGSGGTSVSSISTMYWYDPKRLRSICRTSSPYSNACQNQVILSNPANVCLLRRNSVT